MLSKDFDAPLRWNKKPWVCDVCGKSWSGKMPNIACCESNFFHRRRVFSLSLGDWLDPEVPIEWLADMLDVVRRCDQLDWILCTKRPELFVSRIDAAFLYAWDDEDRTGKAGVSSNLSDWIADWIKSANIPSNVTLLTSVESQEMADKRIPELLKIPAARRGLSCEPLLGPLDLTTGGCLRGPAMQVCPTIDWVIVGGESGPGARACNTKWIRSIVSQCQSAGVPCFVKQLGACIALGSEPGIEEAISHRSGADPSEWPGDLRVQQFPFTVD